MRIVKVKNSDKPNAVEIKALMGDAEYQQLIGHLQELCVFATRTIAERATCIKTGARHSFAKYLLFPVKLRRAFKTDEFDFDKIVCGTVKYREKLYVVYEVPRRI